MHPGCKRVQPRLWPHAPQVAASAEGRGKHNTSLEERLKARGKWAGAGGEAVVYSVRHVVAATPRDPGCDSM